MVPVRNGDILAAMTSETERTITPIWQEPPPPVHTSMEWLKLSGLERLRTAKLDGGFPAAPYSRLTGARPVEYGDGTAVFEMPVSPWLQSSAGVLSGGVMAFLADSPLGVMTKNPPGTVITTSELAMNYLRPATLAAGMLRARSRVIHLGRSFALSEVYIDDAEGRLLAHGTARNLMVSLPVPEGPFQMPTYDDPAPEQPDPYLRPVQGVVLPADVWRQMSGLEIQRRQISGRLPPSPLQELFGIRRLAADEGKVTIACTSTGWLSSPVKRIYGGAIALLADTALTSAAQTTVVAGSAIAPLDLRIQYLRPLMPDGGEITVNATVFHRGKTMGVVNAEVLNPEGKVAATATSTFLAVPDFNWASDTWAVPTDDVEVLEDD
jgi:uncharacterized protein (TIGR00369 family)